MQYLLMGLLLLIGYYFLYRFFLKRTASKSRLPIAALILFVVYAGISAVLIAAFNRFGSPRLTLMMLLALMSTIGLCILLYGFLVHVHQIRAVPALLLVLYLGLVAYLTIFSREEGSRSEVLFDFLMIEKAIKDRSLAPLEHMLVNIVLFIPIGYLFTAVYPRKMNSISMIVAVGLMLSMMIETLQMFLRMGTCDIEDLVANTLGAFLGLIVYRLIHGRTSE